MVLHYTLCILLILIILLQAGKGADIGAVFGGGASQTVFGGRGPATFLNKATAIIAILFLVTSVAMAQITKNKQPKSVLTEVKNKTNVEQPLNVDKNSTENKKSEK